MILMALSFLAKLLLTGSLKFEDGEITLRSSNFIMMPALFISEITNNYLEKNRLYILYLLSWICGFLATNRIVKDFKLDTSDKVYSLTMNIMEAAGIGLYKTHEYFSGRYTHFIIYRNPFAKWFKQYGEPIDYFISGVSAGGGCFVHKSLCQNIEIRCIAKGDKYCEFLTGTEKELKSRGLWEIVKERYKFEQIYPIQKFVYENIDKIDEKILVNKALEMIKKVEEK